MKIRFKELSPDSAYLPNLFRQTGTIFSDLNIVQNALCILLILILLGNWVVWTVGQTIQFDELVNMGYLFRMHLGIVPHKDFWCHYPSLGYLLFVPFFPKTPSYDHAVFLRILASLPVVATIGVITLHCKEITRRGPLIGLITAALVFSDPSICSILTQFRTDGIALLLSVAAIALMFLPVSRVTMLTVPVLVMLSFMVMPKTAYVLIVCSLFFTGKCFADFRWRSIRCLCGGVLMAILIAEGLCRVARSGLIDELYWVHLLISRYTAHCATNGGLPGDFLSAMFLPFLARNKLFIFLATAGLAISLIFWRASDRKTDYLMVIGVVAGVALGTQRSIFPFEQYIYPVFVPLAFVIPFFFKHLKSPRVVNFMVCICSIAAVFISGGRLLEYRDKMSTSELGVQIATMNRLQAALSSSDLVLSVPAELPFQNNLNFVTFDERLWGNPPGFAQFIPQDETRILREFSPNKLSEDLESKKPALIFITRCYSTEWLDVIKAYVNTHSNDYVEFNTLGKIVLARRDVAAKLGIIKP